MMYVPLTSNRGTVLKRKCVGLFDLPRELRDVIYDFALVSSEPIDVLNLTNLYRHHVPHQKLGLSPAILQASRGVSMEALPILYGLNTFRATVKITMKSAVRRHEVMHAIQLLHMDSDYDPPSADLICLTDRPRCEHRFLTLVKRFELQLLPILPQPGNASSFGFDILDHVMCDMCSLVERSALELFILSTDGCLSQDLISRHWSAATAQSIELTMWKAHEWHFERALLAAARQRGYFWLNSNENNDRIRIVQAPAFWPTLRTMTNEEWNFRNKAPRDLRELLPKFKKTGQLRYIL